MNGYGNLRQDSDENKWGKIYRMMSEHRIGVLFVQETHLTALRKAQVQQMFAKCIKSFHSEHPETPTQRAGVAIVLNASIVNTAEASVTEIVPGHALQLSLRCRGGFTRHMLGIYTPTSDGTEECKRFFNNLRVYYESNPACPKPHLMTGDFNNVEDSLDRLPVSDTPDASVLALDDLKLSLGLMIADGWRVTNPTTREYTFHRGSGQNAVFSRLDRIYVVPELFEHVRNWRICESGVKTDHSMVSVQLTADQAPSVGPGRLVFGLHMLKDKTLAKSMNARGREAL